MTRHVATRSGLVLLAVLTSAWLWAPAGMAVPAEAVPSTADTARPLGQAPVLLVLDASGSMNADDGTGRPKIEAARQALLDLVEGLPDDAVVGLRAYGHRTPNTDRDAGCADTELLVPVDTGNAEALRTAVHDLQASGFTPIGASLRASLGDLPQAEGRTVVLISDGIDTCAPPGACETARQIVAEGVALRVETVGFQVDAAAAEQLRCIAEATGGTYRPAADAEDLARELRANVAVGTRVQGGPTPAEAVLIGPGQYVDVIGHPAPRWYAVDLAAGDRVRATASVIGGATTPELPVRVEMSLGATDVLGLTPCDADAVDGVGPFTRTLAVDGLRVEGGRVCADEGRYAIGLQITAPDRLDGDRRAALEALQVPVELLVAVARDPVEATETARPDPPPPTAVVPAPPPPRPTPSRLYVGTFLGSALAGGILGIGLSRRVGP